LLAEVDITRKIFRVRTNQHYGPCVYEGIIAYNIYVRIVRSSIIELVNPVSLLLKRLYLKKDRYIEYYFQKSDLLYLK
jgi:hypothetical protein